MDFGIEMIAPHHAILQKQRLRMAENDADTANDGKSNAFLPEYKTSKDALSDMNIIKLILKRF